MEWRKRRNRCEVTRWETADKLFKTLVYIFTENTVSRCIRPDSKKSHRGTVKVQHDTKVGYQLQLYCICTVKSITEASVRLRCPNLHVYSGLFWSCTEARSGHYFLRGVRSSQYDNREHSRLRRSHKPSEQISAFALVSKESGCILLYQIKSWKGGIDDAALGNLATAS